MINIFNNKIPNLDTLKLTVYINLTKFYHDDNLVACRTDKNTQHELFFEYGIVRLAYSDFIGGDLDNWISKGIIHELTHAFDKNLPLRDKLNIKFNLEYIDLFILNYFFCMSRSEGLAQWTENFLSNQISKGVYIGVPSKQIKEFNKLYSKVIITNYKKMPNVFEMFNTLFYPLGVHMFSIIFLYLIDKNNLNSNFRILTTSNDFECSNLNNYINGGENFFIKKTTNYNLTTFYTILRNFNTTKLLETYILATRYFNIDKSNQIFNQEKLLNLISYLKNQK